MPTEIAKREEVWIVGVGATTAVGCTAPMTAASVRANLSRFKESYMIDRVGEPMILSMAQYVDDDVRGPDRLVTLAQPALQEALAPLSRAVKGGKPRVGFCLGGATRRPGLPTDLGASLLSRLTVDASIAIQPADTELFETGHAAGLMGVRRARDWISSGVFDAVLVGGVDSYYDPDTLEWLDEIKRMHSEANMDAFVPGEGAGFCLLASRTFAGRHGLKPLALVLSAAVTEEPNPFTSQGVCLGEGLTRLLREALSIPVPEPKVADWTICDMNGESFRSKEWMFAYLRTGKKHRDPLEIWHPADCYGDIGAASGPVLCAIAIAAWQRKYARGNRSLVWTASDGPHRSAVLLGHPNLN